MAGLILSEIVPPRFCSSLKKKIERTHIHATKSEPCYERNSNKKRTDLKGKFRIGLKTLFLFSFLKIKK